jgi:predicted CoA-binding protein
MAHGAKDRTRPGRAGLERLFRPRSVAVIGASRRPGSIGWQVLHNLISGGFEGKVFPVNPHAEVLHSIKCYRSVEAIEDAVDLAIVTIPKERVARALLQCARKQVGAVVVITAGFKETGAAGGARGGQACWRRLASTACAWSVPTAWASRMRKRACASTRPSRAPSRGPARWPSCRSRARWAKRSSRKPISSRSASRCSCRWAIAPTSAPTT